MLPATQNTHADATLSDDSRASAADAAAVAIQIESAKDTSAASAAPMAEEENGEATKAWTTKRAAWLCFRTVVAVIALLGFGFIYYFILLMRSFEAERAQQLHEFKLRGTMGNSGPDEACVDRDILPHHPQYIEVSRPEFETMCAFVAATELTCYPEDPFDVFQLYSTENARYFQFLVPDNEPSSSCESANVCAAPKHCKLSDKSYYYYTTAMALARDIAQCNGDIKKSMFVPYVEQYTQSDSDLWNKILTIINELLSVNVKRDTNLATLSAHQLNNVCNLTAINTIFDLYRKTADSENKITDTVTVETLKISSLKLYKTLPDNVQAISFVDFVVRYIVEIAFTLYHLMQDQPGVTARNSCWVNYCEVFLAREFDHVTGSAPLESVQGYLVDSEYIDPIAFKAFCKKIKTGEGTIARLRYAAKDIESSEVDANHT